MPVNASFPSWATELAEKYRGGTIIEFILHGAIHDLVRAQTAKGDREYVGLKTFLEDHIFPRRDAVITYDVSRGITFTKDETAADFNRVVQAIDNPGDHISEIALLKSQIKDGVSRYLYEQTKRRPMVFPVVVEV